MINNKEFEIGELVYFIDKYAIPYKYTVKFGTVLENYCDAVCIQLYDIRKDRIVKEYNYKDNNVNSDKVKITETPYENYATPSRWKKLPKGWNYATKLVETGWVSTGLRKGLCIDNPTDILDAIDEGFLQKVNDIDYSYIDTEIDSKLGWRAIKRYEGGLKGYHPFYTSVRPNEVYATYEEAKAVSDAYEAELERQASLSDLEWSIEQIDCDLNRWAKIYHISDELKQKYRDWIMQLKNLEDVETRVAEGNIQWKYWKNKRWMCINL